jgi:large subunit ribosomal protein L4e
MKTNIFDAQGNFKGEIDLPKVFSISYRPDLIKRAVLAVQSHNRQPYGVDPLAGKRTSAHYHGVRHYRYAMMNREMARLHRIHNQAPPGLNLTARIAPQARKGREAHPPIIERNFWQKINYKERILALKSAIAATALKDVVVKRGHLVNNIVLPVVIDDSFQEIKKTKQLKLVLEKIGLKEELKRISKKKVRAGRGKMRGRKYKKKKGPLIVVAENKGIMNAAKNMSGVDCCLANKLNAELLAPGTNPGRLAIFTESAVKKLGEMYG